MEVKQLTIIETEDGIVGVDPLTGDVYAPNIEGMNGIFSWVGPIFKGGTQAASTGISSTTQTIIGQAAIGEVAKSPTFWSKIGNVAGQIGTKVFDPNTAAGGLTQAVVGNIAANITARGAQYGYNPYGVQQPPQQDNLFDNKTLLIAGGGLAALLVVIIALK